MRALVAVGLALTVVVVAAVLGAKGHVPARGATAFDIRDGETRTFLPSDLVRGDTFRCIDGGGGSGIPSPGEGVGSSGGYSAATAADGTVTVSCDAGPPGNV